MDDSIEEQGEETIVDEKITLVSEVLMYTNHYRHSKDSPVKVMSTTFTEEDLKAAKNMLWEAFADMNILGVNHDRQDSSNRIYMTAMSEDNVYALNVVRDSIYELVHYAVNPTQIPNMNPESANELSLAERWKLSLKSITPLKGLVDKVKSPRSSTIEWPTLRSSNPDSFQPESVQSHHNTCIRGDSGPRGHSGFRSRGRGRGGATVQGHSLLCRNDCGSASISVFGGMQRGGGGSPRAAPVREAAAE